jgi:hypothetical protein
MVLGQAAPGDEIEESLPLQAYAHVLADPVWTLILTIASS